MAACVKDLVNSFNAYFRYEVNSQIEIERLSSIEFPAVIFCNKIQLKVDQTNTNIRTTLDDFKNIMIDHKSNTFDIMRRIMYYINYGLNDFQNGISSQNSSFSLNEMLLNCKFNDITCGVKDFEPIYYRSLGNCFKFSAFKNSSRISTPGRLNGLRLELFLGVPSPNYTLISSTGAYIFVTNTSSRFLSNKEGVTVSAGFETDIMVSQVYLNKLSKPYGDCVSDVKSKNAFDSELFRITMEKMRIYEQKYCLQFCYQKYLTEMCNCSDATLPVINETIQTCYLGSCTENANNNFYKTNLSLNCFDQCPSECNIVNYNLKISQTSFPSPFYADLLIQNDKANGNLRNFKNIEEIKSSVLALNVFYEDISYYFINEVPNKSTEQFVSEIGGIVGLYLGLSLLSFIEIVEVFIKILGIYFKRFQNAVNSFKSSK